jgi:hypothetical protein
MADQSGFDVQRATADHQNTVGPVSEPQMAVKIDLPPPDAGTPEQADIVLGDQLKRTIQPILDLRIGQRLI